VGALGLIVLHNSDFVPHACSRNDMLSHALRRKLGPRQCAVHTKKFYFLPLLIKNFICSIVKINAGAEKIPHEEDS
jgi:hypothetical protein